jgi:hypothetical protein
MRIIYLFRDFTFVPGTFRGSESILISLLPARLMGLEGLAGTAVFKTPMLLQAGFAPVPSGANV